jgi:hypothetical protein
VTISVGFGRIYAGIEKISMEYCQNRKKLTKNAMKGHA